MDTETPVAVAAWLTRAGSPIVDEATDALDAGEDALAVGTRLRSRLAPDRAAAAVAAAVTRRRAREQGVPDADRLLLTRAALEQASRPLVAAHRARRFEGDALVTDLCAGAGLDALALAATTAGVAAVERDLSRALLLRHNAAACDADVRVVAGDALDPPLHVAGLLHADPSRRRGERRARRLDDYGPSVPALVAATEQARGRGIVVSPAVAWHDPGLPTDAEVEFIQVGPDLVEAMLWLGELRSPGVRATATLLPSGCSRTDLGAPEPLPVGPVGEWLVEVTPAAVRARLHDGLGADVGARRLARARALLTTDRDPGASPWWRRWRVEEVLPARQRVVRAWLRSAPSHPLEVAVHGLDADPVAWWRALGSPPRGPEGRRLHLVRTDDGAVCIATLGV